MRYIENNLMNNEKIFYQEKLHWAVFLWPVVWFIAAKYFFGLHMGSIGLFFVLITIVAGISSFTNYNTSEFGITNKRIVVKTGFIKRDSVEILLTKIESIQIRQSVLGRILGFGSITIIGTGGTKEVFKTVNNPLTFRKKASEQIAIIQDN